MSGLVSNSIRTASRALEREIKSDAKRMRKASARALNKTVTTMRARTSKEVRGVINVKAGAVKKLISVSRATPAKLQAAIRMKYKPIPVIDYSGVRPVAAGVSVQLRKDKPRKVFKGGFIERMHGGHRGAFRRVGRSRLPIKEIYGPNAQSVFVEKLPVLENASVPVLQKNMDHEISYEMSK